MRSLVAKAAAIVAAVGAATIASGAAAAGGPVPAAGYSVSVFAKGTAAYNNPDSLTSDGTYVYVGYQNNAAPDGSSGHSVVVQYRMDGSTVRGWLLQGKCDGLRVDPQTKKVWALENEDANPHLTIIDPVSASLTQYTFPAPPHGGGYDDLAFTRGGTFISASNPNPEPSFHKQAVSRVELVGNTVQLTPILFDDSTAISRTTHKSVQLQLTDPDSMSIDAQGNLVLDSQADSLHVIVHQPGTEDQRVEVLSLSNQVDDSAWVGRHADGGRLLVADHSGNTVYWISRQDGFKSGSAYSASPSGSPVSGVVSKVNTRTGALSPVVTGLVDPHGLIWVSGQGDASDGGDSDSNSNN